MTEPLLATALIFLSVLSWRFSPSRHVWIGLGITLLLFALLTFVVINSEGSPLKPNFVSATPGVELWLRIIAAAWWMLGARAAIAIGSAIALAGRRSREAKLVSDLISGGIYLTALLVVINIVFNVPIGGLVATSGVIAIVLGLALQNTLADVFAGVAVQIEGPMALGDRIWIDGPLEGEVVQINWRSVHIRTDGNDIAIVPHSIIAKSRIINRSHPTARRSDSVEVSCPATEAPDRIIELMKRALLLSPHVMTMPAPTVVLARLGRRDNRYEVSFSVASSEILGETRTKLLREIARQFRYEGIRPARRGAAQTGDLPHKADDHGHAEALAGPTQTSLQPSSAKPTMKASGIDRARISRAQSCYPADHLLSELAIFHHLSPEHRQVLVDKLVGRALEPQDIVFSQGEAEGSLFIIASGVLEVSRRDQGKVHVIGRIGSGDYIGEIGLLSGAPHAATVTALTPCVVYELGKAAIAPILAEEADLLSAFETSARHGQELLARAAAAAAGAQAGPPGQLLARIRAFFNLPDSGVRY